MQFLFCENNLAGFLSAVYHKYYFEKDADKITSDLNAVTLADTYITVETDLTLSRKVRAGIIKKIGGDGYRDIASAYLSCNPDKENILLDYLSLVFKYGRGAFTMYAHPYAIAFNDMLRKVTGEAHRFKGFLRFQELENGVFYSYFSGDNDVLELLIPHFTARFNSQKFVIHDIGRGKLACWDGDNLTLMPAPDTVNVVLSENEILFSSLWKEYFNNVNIESRKNTRQQNHFLPKKYRWFMNEF